MLREEKICLKKMLIFDKKLLSHLSVWKECLPYTDAYTMSTVVQKHSGSDSRFQYYIESTAKMAAIWKLEVRMTKYLMCTYKGQVCIFQIWSFYLQPRG